jgi:hypothetical protein
MRPKEANKEAIKKIIKEDIKPDAATAEQARRRKASGILVAILVFVVAYAVFVIRFDHWGLALGWMPSTIVAAAFGWIAYCFPWIGEVVALLLELATLLG